ncbi:MAG: class I SAM-dependent methyltransferase [Bacteroidia bacterium]
MGKNKQEVAGYYDQFSNHQTRLGVNIRHRTIFKNLVNCGLLSSANVLEIGCGIGTVSSLIIPAISQGNFIGVDISPESISIAKNKLAKYTNAKFIVSDMSDFVSELKFDFIVLPDVLEHIPVEQHASLFQTLNKHSHEKTVVLINIPEPYTLDWTRRNHPDRLQIIDQSLSLQDLCNNIYPSGYYLFSVSPYGLQYEHEEYLSIVLKRNHPRMNIQPRSKFEKTVENLRSKF